MMYRFEDEKYCVWKLPQDERYCYNCSLCNTFRTFCQVDPLPCGNTFMIMDLELSCRFTVKEML